jgi:hypothetical protein
VFALALGLAPYFVNYDGRQLARTKSTAPIGPTTPASTSSGKAPAAAVFTANVPRVQPPRPVDASETGPFNHLEPDRAQRKTLYEAEELAVAACMVQRGFDYTPNRFVEADPADELPRFRTGDVDVASSIGYGIVEALEVGEIPAPPDVNEPTIAALTAEQQQKRDQALFGPRLASGHDAGHADDPNWARVETGRGGFKLWYRGSCFAQARRAVQGDELVYARSLARMRALLRDADQAAERAPEVLTGLADWRTCMGLAGYAYDVPGAAAKELQQQLQAGQLTLDELRLREIDIASEDARCFQAANLNRLFAQARARAQRALALEHAVEVEVSRELHRAALDRAQGLLDTSPR